MYEIIAANRSRPTHYFLKFLIVMKIIFLLSFVFCLHASATSYGQKASVNLKNASLQEVFYELAKQTRYNFICDPIDVKAIPPVTINVKNKPLMDILYSFIDRNAYDITIFEKEQNILISKRINAMVIADIVIKGRVTDDKGVPIPGASVKIKDTSIARLTDTEGNYTITVPNESAIIVISYTSYQPEETAVGKQRIINFRLKEQTIGLNDVVIIGYAAVERRELTGAVSSISAKQLKDVPLNSAAQALQGRLAGVQITTSEGAPGAPIDIAIRGRNSITQSGSPLYVVDGIQIENALDVLSPQDIESINILKDAASTAIYGARGSNGVVIITTKGGKNTNGKFTVNFNSFAGINQLTKKLDMMDPYNFVLYQYEKATYTGSTIDAGSAARYIGTINNYDTIAPTYTNYPNAMDWQERMMGRNALQTTQNISISGGSSATQFSLSLTNNSQEGLLLNSEYNRKLVNFRLDQKVSNTVRAGFNVRYNNQQILGAGTSDLGSANNNRLRQYTRYRPLILPGQDEDTYDQDLSEYNPGNQLNLINPLLLSAAEYRLSSGTVYNLGGYLNLNISKTLQFRSTFGYDFTNTENRLFDDVITANSRNNGLRMPIAGLSENTRKVINNSNVLTYTNTNFLKKGSRLTVLAGHEIYQTRAFANSQTIRYFPEGTTSEIAFANFGLANPPAGFTQPKPTSSDVETRQLSFFSRIAYDYNRKYLLTLNLRADGSSLFGPDYSNVFVASDSTNNKWAYFPSASLAWRLSEEKFMKNIKFIDEAKVRLSYGTSGNNRIDAYGYATNFTIPANAGYGLNNILNYTLIPPNRFGNAGIKWESLTSQNLGIDLILFKQKLDVTVDIYSNTTKNLLIENTYPANTGYRTQYQNVGTTRNNGIELQLNASLLEKKNFSWTTGFNIAFNQNKIVRLGDQTSFTTSSGFFATAGNPADYLIEAGRSIGTVYGLKVEGFYGVDDFTTSPISNATYPSLTYQYALKPGLADPRAVITDLVQPGQIKYADVNGDGKIDLNDRTVIGNVLPDFTGGISQQLNYKNFDLSVFLNFSYGNDIYNANKLELSSAYNLDANMLALMNDRWKVIDGSGNLVQKQLNATTVIGVSPTELAGINAGAKIWTPIRSTLSYYPSSYAIEDGSYLRINNITLGYTLPQTLAKKLKMSSFRVYATTNNVATITGYSGYDPDVSSRRSVLTPGVDYSAYPRAKSFLLGLNVTF